MVIIVCMKSYNVPLFTGHIRLGHLELEARSGLTSPTHLYIDAANIIMHYQSYITAESITMQVNDLSLEGESVLDVSGRGPEAGIGLGAGVDVLGMMLGAGHGGFGGGANLVNYTQGKYIYLLLFWAQLFTHFPFLKGRGIYIDFILCEQRIILNIYNQDDYFKCASVLFV